MDGWTISRRPDAESFQGAGEDHWLQEDRLALHVPLEQTGTHDYAEYVSIIDSLGDSSRSDIKKKM
jgi:hypothetical protein